MYLMFLKEEKGAALVIVMVIMVVLMLLSTVFLFTMSTEGKQSLTHDRKTQAYYYARSGVGAALSWLEAADYALDQTTYLCGDLDNLQVTESAPAQGAPVMVTLEPQAESKEITVTAAGNYYDSTERVILTLALEGGQPGIEIPPFDLALYAISSGSQGKPSIKLLGSTALSGPVGTNASGAGAIHFDSWPDPRTLVSGTLSIAPGADPEEVIYVSGYDVQAEDVIGEGITTDFRTYPDPVFPDFPDNLPHRPDFTTPWVEGEYYEINQDGSYNLIEVSSDRTLHIDLRGGERIISVNRLHISQGHIVLKNTGADGRLILYVRDSITLDGSSTINDGGSIENVMLYYKGSGQPDIGGDTRFVGNLFAESAPISIGGSNGVTGHIITGGSYVTISGDADMYTRVLYAPHAHVSVEGSGQIKGTVIADSLEASGGSNPAIEYSELDPDTFPFEIFPDGTGGGFYPPTGGSWVIKSWR